MKRLLQAKTFTQFCSLAFWCRWDKALINISILFWISFGLVKAGKYIGLLFGPSTLINDITTAFIATTALLTAGLINKSREAP